MNRQQIRQLAKKYNLNINQSKVLNNLVEMAQIKKVYDDYKPIPEGTKVKLNIERIKSHPDYNRLTEPYKTFVESNKDTVFTVKYDPQSTEHFVLCLKECIWKFWEGDLIVVEDKDE
jgi:hypothetical protein